MAQSRSVSPMPDNIKEIYNNVPQHTIYRLPDRSFLRLPRHLLRRVGTKLLYGGAILGSLYGGYKLGQYKGKSFFANHGGNGRSNYTRSNM